MTVMAEPIRQAALTTSVSALRKLADYKLPPELDRRILDLGERKETLTTEERAEYHAWVELIEQRTIEKFEAALALRGLAELFPEVETNP